MTQHIVVLIIVVMTTAAASQLYRAGLFLSRCKQGRRSRQSARALIALELGCLTAVAQVALPAAAWEQWGGDRGGTRFSPLRQITPANVNRLVRAWEFRTGDLSRRDPRDMAWTKFEGTPLFVEAA